MKYTKEQIAKVARECAKQDALHDNEYLGKIGCMLDYLLGRIAELEKDAALWIDMRDKVSKDWGTYRPMFYLLAEVGCNEQIQEIQYAVDSYMQKD